MSSSLLAIRHSSTRRLGHDPANPRSLALISDSTMTVQPIKRGLKSAALRSGIYRRRLSRKGLPGVAVLCYHGVPNDDEAGRMPFTNLHVTARTFEAHCRLLRDTLHPVSLTDWRAALAGGRALPQRAVLVTFDDGYRTVLTHALPALRRFGIPAVVFISTGPVADGSLFSFDAMARKRRTPSAVRAANAPGAADPTGVVASVPAAPGDPAAPLTVEELRELAAAPEIEIGAHTVSHRILSNCPLEEQRREIVESKQQLESWTGAPVRAFAYPNGRPGFDYGEGTVSLVQEAGFDFGFTTRQAFAEANGSVLEIPRFVVLAAIDAAELAHRLAYSWPR